MGGCLGKNKKQSKPISDASSHTKRSCDHSTTKMFHSDSCLSGASSVANEDSLLSCKYLYSLPTLVFASCSDNSVEESLILRRPNFATESFQLNSEEPFDASVLRYYEQNLHHPACSSPSETSDDEDDEWKFHLLSPYEFNELRSAIISMRATGECRCSTLPPNCFRNDPTLIGRDPERRFVREEAEDWLDPWMYWPEVEKKQEGSEERHQSPRDGSSSSSLKSSSEEEEGFNIPIPFLNTNLLRISSNGVRVGIPGLLEAQIGSSSKLIAFNKQIM